MRCLHCNKKLSLLKLAKGDSFCSAEHFDAYQLQLSKSAYDRLISAPDEETPKTPLVIHEVPAAELEADSALASLSAFRAPEKPAAPPPVAASIEAPPTAPPYAGFLASPLPSFPPHEPVPASVPDASEPVAAPRDLAFPVHDVDATVCILNLYLRLGFAETPPRNWTRLRDAFAPPEAFPGAIAKPALAAELREPSEMEAIENPAPSEPAVAVGLEPVHLEPVDPEPAQADFIEADQIGPPPAVYAEAVEPSVAIHVESIDPPPVHVHPIEALPAPPRSAEPARPAAKRLAFLIAPSFQEREGEASRFDADASSAPEDWKLAPVLDHVQQPPRSWSGRLSQWTEFSRSGRVEPKNASGVPVQSGFVLPAAGEMLLPKNSTVESYQWQVLDGSIDLARPPLEVVGVATEAIDYAAPVPALVRPNATLTPNIDRAQILNDAAHTLLREVLETRPRGQEPTFQAAPAEALAVGLPSMLAPFPDWEGFSSRTWENETGRLSLPTSMPDAELRPCLKRPWQQSDVPQPPNPDPAPVGLAPAIHHLAPTTILDQPVLNPSTLLGNLFEQTFTQAASAGFGQPEWSAKAVTGLLPAGDIPSRDKKLGLCSLTANWQPCQPAAHEVALFRFLAVRRSTILPSARAWPRLGALSQ